MQTVHPWPPVLPGMGGLFLLLLTVRVLRPRLCMFPQCIEGLNGFASASDFLGSSARRRQQPRIHFPSVIPRPRQSHAFR